MPAIMSFVTSTAHFWNWQAFKKQIISEPIIQEHAEEDKMLRADWKVRGFWEPQKDAFFDGCILNAESPSLAGSSVESLFTTRKTKKNNLYLTAAKARRATFTPIIATCNAVVDKDSEFYFKRMAIHLSKNGNLFILKL